MKIAVSSIEEILQVCKVIDKSVSRTFEFNQKYLFLKISKF